MSMKITVTRIYLDLVLATISKTAERNTFKYSSDEFIAPAGRKQYAIKPAIKRL